jgi:hypothetical protein
MRRCPKCNRAYETDTQKFCTHDGGLLFDIDPGLTETVQLDSKKIRDEVAKPTTRDLDAQLPAQFDPEATVITSAGPDPEATFITPSRRDDVTMQVRARDTGELEPQPTQHEITPPAAATSGPIPTPPAPPTSGPIAPPAAPPASGPIAPPQTSAPLPPPQAASGPIVTPAASQVPQFAPQQPGQPLAAAPPKKKSKLPLILGILAVLVVLGLGVVIAAYLLLLRFSSRPNAPIVTSEPSRTTSAPAVAASPAEALAAAANEPEAYVPAPGAEQFVNSKENLDGRLLEHYVDFSFFYPGTWQKDPKAGVPGASNFAKVERRIPPDFTQENFAVGWYSSSGSAAGDRALFPGLAENLSAQLATNFPEYRKVSEGATKAGVYDGYEFRFEAMSRDTPKGDIKIWGRVIFVPPSHGGTTGATLLMLATSLAPELETVDDIGQKGELPMLLESFRFGKK